MRNQIAISIVSVLLLIIACSKKTNRPLTIAVSRTSDNYRTWLLAEDSTLVIINLYDLPVDSACEVLKICDGLLLTGGDDIFPGTYKQVDDTVLCEGSDRFRDSLELALIMVARKLEMPIFGICRGLQMLNIQAGGTLIPDIPARSSGYIPHRCIDWKNCYHDIMVDTSSLLFISTGIKTGTVNTNHHQAIDRLGKGLCITAYSQDSIPEAIEATPESYHGFLMAVQWHPERLLAYRQMSSPLSNRFIGAAILYKNRPDRTEH
ncbi:MAG: peptidase C26 [Bacteroidetes bacterium HGW-Bacteroidetes-22]|nr:MAG: peptidase C26 [Bacteroidetes bacterium HGW-Bacteroidetes-22]